MTMISAPIPAPAKNLKAMSHPADGAKAQASVKTEYRSSSVMNTIRRPKRSLPMPKAIVPTNMPKKPEAMNSVNCWSVRKWDCCSAAPIYATTKMSYRSKKLPSETSAMNRRWKRPSGSRSMRAAMEAVPVIQRTSGAEAPLCCCLECRGSSRDPQSSRSTSLRLLEDADFFQIFQVFDDKGARDGAVLRGDGVADLLSVPVTVGEIEDFVGVLFATAPKAFVVENFRHRRDSRGFSVIDEIVGAEDCDLAFRFRLPFENQKAIAAWCRVGNE